jgi:hypothetical protein
MKKSENAIVKWSLSKDNVACEAVVVNGVFQHIECKSLTDEADKTMVFIGNFEQARFLRDFVNEIEGEVKALMAKSQKASIGNNTPVNGR